MSFIEQGLEHNRECKLGSVRCGSAIGVTGAEVRWLLRRGWTDKINFELNNINLLASSPIKPSTRLSGVVLASELVLSFGRGTFREITVSKLLPKIRAKSSDIFERYAILASQVALRKMRSVEVTLQRNCLAPETPANQSKKSSHRRLKDDT